MRAYQQAIEMNRQLALVAARIERHDRDLVRQMKRAASSVALNLADSLGNRGGSRELRFQTALGSAREVQACIDVAVAWGYLGTVPGQAKDHVDRVVGMLCNLVKARR